MIMSQFPLGRKCGILKLLLVTHQAPFMKTGGDANNCFADPLPLMRKYIHEVHHSGLDLFMWLLNSIHPIMVAYCTHRSAELLQGSHQLLSPPSTHLIKVLIQLGKIKTFKIIYLQRFCKIVATPCLRSGDFNLQVLTLDVISSRQQETDQS